MCREDCSVTATPTRPGNWLRVPGGSAGRHPSRPAGGLLPPSGRRPAGGGGGRPAPRTAPLRPPLPAGWRPEPTGDLLERRRRGHPSEANFESHHLRRHTRNLVDAQQSVTSATRGENTLDLAVSSGGTAFSDVRDKLFESDHSVVDTCFMLDIGVPPRPTRSKAYNYKRADFSGLRQALRAIPWTVLEETDVDGAVSLFYEFAFNTIAHYVPIVEIRQQFPPWFDRSVRNLLRIKERAHRMKKANSSPENVALHARARSEFKRCADQSYQNYLLSLIHDFRNNSKRFWTFVKSLKSSARTPPVLENNGTVIRDDIERANCFNACFAKNSVTPA